MILFYHSTTSTLSYLTNKQKHNYIHQQVFTIDTTTQRMPGILSP